MIKKKETYKAYKGLKKKSLVRLIKFLKKYKPDFVFEDIERIENILIRGINEDDSNFYMPPIDLSNFFKQYYFSKNDFKTVQVTEFYESKPDFIQDGEDWE